VIARLRGALIERGLDHVVVDAGGVGYQAFCSRNTLVALPDVGGAGATVDLYVHTHVSEGAIALFGFANEAEREVFRLLLGISGIGPRTAIATLGGMRLGDLVTAVTRGDTRRLQAIPGIGKKTAERIVLELKDKIGRVPLGPAERGDAGAEAAGAAADDAAKAGGGERGAASAADVLGDLRSALQNLGYKTAEVERRVDELRSRANRGVSVGELLREALRGGGGGGGGT
jgi:Holliday junction DNA helicase RuvA